MKPIRYTTRKVPMRLRETLSLWWRCILTGRCVWKTTRTEFDAVKPGEPGYDDAPFEDAIIFNEDVWSCRMDGSVKP